MKFKVGQRVALLDKTCGPIHGVKNLLYKRYRDRKELIPRYGIIVSRDKDHVKWGAHYKVIVDDYYDEYHRHKTVMFYEDDLAFEHSKWLEEDLFVL